MSQAPHLHFDLETVREVAQLLRESELAEICIETTGEEENATRLFLRRSGAQVAMPALHSAMVGYPVAEEAEPEVEAAAEPVAAHVNVTSPGVGLFRPNAKSPVKVGDLVKAAQSLGAVESLRVPNEVHAPKAGRLAEVLCHDGQGVEFGQVLFVIEETA